MPSLNLPKLSLAIPFESVLTLKDLLLNLNVTSTFLYALLLPSTNLTENVALLPEETYKSSAINLVPLTKTCLEIVLDL